MTGERLLIVDDEESVRSLLEMLCTREGYQVVAAGDVRGALDALDRGFFHLLILDLRLPDDSGMEVLRYAKQLHPASEVIILTAFGDLPTAIEALRLGAYDYLQKPVPDLQLIRNTIGRALERQRLALHNVELLRDLREANSEVQFRRRQQLQNINYIGQALAGALNVDEVAGLLVSALLGLTRCDGAAVLLLRKNRGSGPWALVGGRRGLSADNRGSLVAAMTQRLLAGPGALDGVDIPASSLEGTTPEIDVFPGVVSEETDEEPWRCLEFGWLAARGELQGLVALAGHSQGDFAEEDLDVFRILLTQGSVALANAYLFLRTRELASRDSLTELYNRRHFYELLDAEISRCERHGMELVVIMLDLDKENGMGLKTINDLFGHQAGDALLRAVAAFLVSNVRRADVVARYGGDEFVIMAPQTSSQEGFALATRICDQLRTELFTVSGHPVRVTASFGASVFKPGCGRNADTLVGLADRGLYQAKNEGGNRACLLDE